MAFNIRTLHHNVNSKNRVLQKFNKVNNNVRNVLHQYTMQSSQDTLVKYSDLVCMGHHNINFKMRISNKKPIILTNHNTIIHSQKFGTTNEYRTKFVRNKLYTIV